MISTFRGFELLAVSFQRSAFSLDVPIRADGCIYTADDLQSESVIVEDTATDCQGCGVTQVASPSNGVYDEV
jgi:hypothetical protein